MTVREQADHAADVRELFLAPGNPYGCAETALLVLDRHFGARDATGGTEAMALNGGVACSGGTCGAITGAALALGRLAGRRISDRPRAKRVARELTAGVIDAFRAAEGAIDCRTLTGVDLRAPGSHDAFIASGTWRVDCLRRIERVVGQVSPLAEPAAWGAAIRDIEGMTETGPGHGPASA